MPRRDYVQLALVAVILALFICGWNLSPALGQVNSVSEVPAQHESAAADPKQQAVAPTPQFNLAPGFYTEPVTLFISAGGQAVIRYTTDGSEPDENSAVFSAPVVLDSRAGEPNDISMIPTNAINPGQDPYNEAWQPPLGEVFKIHTIRARAFVPGMAPSEIITGSFLVDEAGESRYSLPVISITTNRDNFFDDDIGIYVPGNNLNYNQRGREWERPAWIEFFENDGSLAFSQGIGVRIHGGTSRNRPRKSLRLYARSDYGTSWISHQIFPDKPIGQFKRLILRNSGNDWDRTIFRDSFMQSLMRGMEVDMQHSRPAIVFINGEYWGVHNMRDRLDVRYLQTHHDTDPDNEESYTIAENNGVFDDGNPEGLTHYNQMRSFLNNPGVVSNTNFDELRNRMDVENFADYFLAQVYFRNTDWPGNNKQYWRGTDPTLPDGVPGSDGRWRWMMFDTDFGFGLDFDYVTGHQEGAAHNTLAFALQENGPGWPNPDWSTFIPRRLLQNPDYRNAFINRAADLLNTAFHPEYVAARLDSLEAIYLPEMQEHINRWRRPVSVSSWQQNVQIMRDFAVERPAFMRQHIRQQFNLSSAPAQITLDVSDPAHGFIRINRTEIRQGTPGITAQPYPWTGTYFTGIAVTLEAEARTGYVFSEWTGSVSSTEAVITVSPQQATSVTAVFAPQDDDVTDPPIEPWVMAQGDYTFSSWEASTPAGSYPPHMIFYQTDSSDPDLTSVFEQPWVLPYDLSSRSRINGLGDDGIGFINTANAQENGGGWLGTAVLALNTEGITQLYAGWRGGTVLPNSRVYNIRLQYRINPNDAFEDVTDSSGQPVQYERNSIAGHSSFVGPVALPQAMLNRSYAELRWVYYYTGVRLDNESGQRSKLRLTDIKISAEPFEVPEPLQFVQLRQTAQAGTTLQPFQVIVTDGAGHTDTGFNGEVTLSLAEGPGTLNGTLTVTASAGQAVFSDLVFSAAGTYRIQAEAHSETVVSDPIRVVALTEIIMPAIVQGAQPENNDRIPVAYRLRLEGLLPDTTYRFANRVIEESDGFEQDGAGNMIFAGNEAASFIRTTDSPDFSPSAFESGHFTLSTDEAGVFEGWFITEPSGNERFTPGNFLRIRLLLNDGQNGSTIHHVIDTFSEFQVLDFGELTGQATGVAAFSEADPGNFIVLYADEAGAERPVYATFVQQTGVQFDERYASFFREWVEETEGGWAAMIPNDFPSGIRRIEERTLADGLIIETKQSEDGSWGEGVPTANPVGGLTFPILLDFLSPVDVPSEPGEAAAEFILNQNYPNPFNPSTQISYTLPESVHVRLDVFSVNGQLVTTLQNGVQSAGTHTVVFDSRNFPIASGVYLYRIETGSFVQVKKMLLVK
ncbi:Por secretion system C-terminal sorting domain-containing protein [Cyclonatronum proteinivorum]|uniref:Por secretion system C-terminal sorting domain-containing protein n=1 Tax=Cyclonatronum proteinivorum TaxID=1457365 RepID=A0A345UGL8_9BACT|nr:CotH kinase family protein [Cyclonatronum proteinivorum]AXI99619.1 Por secretion system C-terminal sorting domain-containing protein [Cyclonatronum proteinivorum]